DNNVHPANTYRLADALIKANKRFDFFIIPGKRHGYADAASYINVLRGDYFCKYLLGQSATSVDIVELNRETQQNGGGGRRTNGGGRQKEERREGRAESTPQGAKQSAGPCLEDLPQEQPGAVTRTGRADDGAGDLVLERAIAEPGRQHPSGRLPAIPAER